MLVLDDNYIIIAHIPTCLSVNMNGYIEVQIASVTFQPMTDWKVTTVTNGMSLSDICIPTVLKYKPIFRKTLKVKKSVPCLSSTKWSWKMMLSIVKYWNCVTKKA